MADAKENTPEPGSALQDLESQLDSLLAKINEQTAEAASAQPAPAQAQAQSAPALQTAGSKSAPGKATPEKAAAEKAVAARDLEIDPNALAEADFTAPPTLSADDLAGDDLAQQIQELLDDARDAANGGAPAAAAPAPAAPQVSEPAPVAAAAKAAASKDESDASLEMDGTFEAPPEDAVPEGTAIDGPIISLTGATTLPEPAPAKTATPPPPAKPGPAPAPAPVAPAAEAKPAAPPERKIKQLDAEIAASADDMVAGDFETPEQALAAENGGVPDPIAAAAAAAEREQRVAQATEEAAAASSVPDAVQDSAHEEEKDPDLDGAFSSPEDLLGEDKAGTDAAPTEPVLSPSAQAVARELDEQPEQAGQHLVPRPAPQKLPDTDSAVPLSPRVPIAQRIREFLLAVAAVGPDAVKRVLALINRPLMRLSAENRDLVGWAGLITLFPALVLIGWLVVVGPPPPREPAPPAADSHEAAAEHGEHGKPDAHGAKPEAKKKEAGGHGAATKEKASGGHGAPAKEKPAEGHGAPAKKEASGHGAPAADKHAPQASAHGGH